MKKGWKIFFLILFIVIAIAIPVSLFIHYYNIDIAAIWNTWGLQEDDTIVKPDTINYLKLLLFKSSFYIIPPFCIFFGLLILNSKKLTGRKKWIYFIDGFSFWYLGLLTLKLFANEILELDRCYNFTFFNGVESMQLLVGYIISFIIKKNVELNKPYEKNNWPNFIYNYTLVAWLLWKFAYLYLPFVVAYRSTILV